jgi:gliding motility-associated-like protein
LNRTLHILLLIATVYLFAHRVQAQSDVVLPWACAGSQETYWVKGFNGSSDFEWNVYFNDGSGTPQRVTEQVLTYNSLNGDTVLISWPNDPDKGGLYTFEVVETTAYGCIGTVYTENIVVNSPAITLSFDDVPGSFFVCENQTAVLDPGADFINYLWQDGTTDEQYLTTEAGTYQVRLIDSEFSCAFHNIEAGFHPLPDIDLGRDTTLFGSQTLLLDADGSGIMSWQWYTYNYNINEWGSQPIANTPTYLVEGTSGNQWISVWVQDNNGCVNSDSIRIAGTDYSNFRIPKAFVPGSPIAENRVWNFPAPPEDGGQPLYTFLTDVDVRVFNRWGKQVWESKGAYQPWDGRDNNGRPLPMDSYHYIIRIRVDGKVFLYKGSVTIIR